MVDKKIKYVLSDFMLDGGKGHKTRTQYGQYGKSKDFGWSKGTGKQKNTSRSFGQPPENVDPNGQNGQNGYNDGRGESFSKQEWEDFQDKLRSHQIAVQDWGNLNTNRSRPGAIPWNSKNNPERITPLGKREKLRRLKK